MGFAASSARLYMLLARKMDLEFQLQQINQARLRLTNVLDKLYASAQSLEPENPAVVLQEQFMERVHGMQNAGTVFGLITLVGASIGSVGGGYIASRMRKTRSNAYSLMCAVSLSIAVPITTAAFLAPNLMLTSIAMFFAVIFLFACTGPVNTLILETVPVHLRCMSMAGSIFMIHILGDFWSPSLVGRVSDATGGNLSLALMLLPAFLVVGAAFWFRLAALMKRADAKLAHSVA